MRKKVSTGVRRIGRCCGEQRDLGALLLDGCLQAAGGNAGGRGVPPTRRRADARAAGGGPARCPCVVAPWAQRPCVRTRRGTGEAHLGGGSGAGGTEPAVCAPLHRARADRQGPLRTARIERSRSQDDPGRPLKMQLFVVTGKAWRALDLALCWAGTSSQVPTCFDPPCVCRWLPPSWY